MSMAAMRKMTMKSFTDRGADTAHHLQRKAHAVLVAAAPAVVAPVGFLHQEGAEQVARGADDFHTVVTRLLRTAGAVGEIRQLLLDAFLVQRRRCHGSNTRFHCGGSNRIGSGRQRAGVQDLHADLHGGIRRVHRLRDNAVLRRFLRGLQPGAKTALGVGRDTAGNDHAHAAAGAFGKVGGHALETVFRLLQPRVHGAHDGPVLDGGETQVEG